MTSASEMRDDAIVRIAELLGCSPEALANGAGPADLRDASELLSLWSEIGNEGDRAKLLELARSLANQ